MPHLIWHHLIRLVGLLTLFVLLVPGTASADRYVITLDPAVADEPVSGRLMLLFITESGGRWERISPMEDAPFFDPPQPIASVEVRDLKPGESVIVDGSVHAFPKPLSELSGRVRVQAVLRTDWTERALSDGPGNLYSDVKVVELDPERDDRIELSLTNTVTAERPTRRARNVRYVELRSEILSEFYGRDVYHRVGVALPNGHPDVTHRAGFAQPSSPDDVAPHEREWPAVYVIPGYGGRYTRIDRYGLMLEAAAPEFAPEAVFIIPDPESPLGHHAFIDNENHGPRGTAFVTELIPHLEREFRLAARPEGRLLYGHSSGGWTVLWLQLHWPQVFGMCWSSAPDPIDFRRFQRTNIYEEPNLYFEAEGVETPSYRQTSVHDVETVLMTVRQEGLMEYAMHPHGWSGQQWDAWEAMFSPKDPESGLPKPMYNGLTGEIDREVAEQWRRYDMSHLVSTNWEHFGPIVRDQVRIVCGTHDSYYLNLAVELFAERVRTLATQSGWDLDEHPHYVWMIDGASHGGVVDLSTQRIHNEMKAYFRQHGLHD